MWKGHSCVGFGHCVTRIALYELKYIHFDVKKNN